VTFVHVPQGDKGATIVASPEKPKEITPDRDVHMTPTPAHGNFPQTEALGAGNSRLIASPTYVQSLDVPTRVRVKSARGRSHGYPS
jgi:hypothetical protein